ncbi:PAS domain-containing protein [Litoreibacter ascidiaceicola]|uniref:PAS domain-containing protein n=1 Tax=Litoreibacter ascidiaceicola TaxID=1486859 RepID=A0A1M5AYA6_9RHOB|nr:PAS domain-containing protein [Litoreibacter ascidiaceicola]SHF35254.1 PAS domain-containing protein [Litoreibacter ascidiaceicola]
MADLLFEFAATMALGALLGAMAVYSLLRLTTPPKSADKSRLEFRFEKRELVGACPRARRSLSLEDLDEDVYHQLIDRLGRIFPDLRQRLDDTSLHSASFTLSEATQNGPALLDVEAHGGSLRLRLSGIDAPLSRKVLVDSDQATAVAAELAVLRAATETAPFLSWRETADGAVDWANKAYTTAAGEADIPRKDSSWPPARLFHGGAVAQSGDQAHPKRSTLMMNSGERRTYEVLRYGSGNGTLNFALDVGATIKAEESLRSFMQTLTQTFAALPIGLAIFDRSRSLVMFNPALMDLTNLEPEWLSARPTLYDFVNQLREKRMLPERRDFADWRKKITELEKSAEDGTYCETWTLPTGQTYRVTGRPHPEGAVAFLMEDITAEMSLTRKFRREMSMNQALLDHLPEALAVFADDGVITMTNAAYDALWGTDPEDALGQLTITDATRLWQASSAPNPIWGDARDFVSQRGDRSEWTDTATLANGLVVTCRFQPLAGGATLVGFMPAHQSALLPPHSAQLTAISS